MTRIARRTARVLLLAATLTAPTITTAQALSPSVPSESTPLPGTPPLIADNIADLDEAPPIAVAAIVQLVSLGIYPLEEGSLAKPNELIDENTLAFMMVNLLTPGITDEFPAEAADAAAYLDVMSRGALTQVAGTVSAATYLKVLLALLELQPERAESVRRAIEQRYPAFGSGNPNAPLTRAGAALLLWQTLAILREP